MRQIMRSSLDYAGFAQLCARSPIMRKIMRAHNRIIQRSLVESDVCDCLVSAVNWLAFLSQLLSAFYCHSYSVPWVLSVLWHCWLGGRKGIRPVKNWVVRCWHGYLSGVRCRLAQLMPLPLTVSCFSKLQIGFTSLVPAHLGSPRKGPLNGCVCVCTRVRARARVCVLLSALICWLLREGSDMPGLSNANTSSIAVLSR